MPRSVRWNNLQRRLGILFVQCAVPYRRCQEKIQCSKRKILLTLLLISTRNISVVSRSLSESLHRKDRICPKYYRADLVRCGDIEDSAAERLFTPLRYDSIVASYKTSPGEAVNGCRNLKQNEQDFVLICLSWRFRRQKAVFRQEIGILREGRLHPLLKRSFTVLQVAVNVMHAMLRYTSAAVQIEVWCHIQYSGIKPWLSQYPNFIMHQDRQRATELISSDGFSGTTASVLSVFSDSSCCFQGRMTGSKDNEVVGLQRWNATGICDLPGIKQICKYVQKAFFQHLPSWDVDGDRFSTRQVFEVNSSAYRCTYSFQLQTLRGSTWRGKDCSDVDKNVHPGRKWVTVTELMPDLTNRLSPRPSKNDRIFDTNCNGIFVSWSNIGNLVWLQHP